MGDGLNTALLLGRGLEISYSSDIHPELASASA